VTTRYQPVDVGILNRMAGYSIEPAPRTRFELLGIVVMLILVVILPRRVLTRMGVVAQEAEREEGS